MRKEEVEGLPERTMDECGAPKSAAPKRPMRNHHGSHAYDQGRRYGIKASVEWLHLEADSMNDPKARAILNAAAWHLGNAFHAPQIQPPYPVASREAESSPPKAVQPIRDALNQLTQDIHQAGKD